MSRASFGVFAVNTLAIGDEPVESESEANVSPAAEPPFSPAKHLLIFKTGVKRPVGVAVAGATPILPLQGAHRDAFTS